MHEKNKWSFWGVVLAAAAITCVPSTMMMDAAHSYRRFLEGFEAVPLRATRVRFVPHSDGRAWAQAETRLDFAEFKLRAPKAKSVQLIGEFNGWKEETLAMSRQPDGYWELALPLPRGRHYYLFVVDGERRLDPATRDTQDVDGRPVSVKVVP